MSEHNKRELRIRLCALRLRYQRELRIRLCALRLRYQRAWQSQASSCRLAAMLTEIELVRQRLASDSPGPEALNR